MFVVVSHQGLLDISYSTVICAPVYSNYHGLKTQVLVGKDEGLKAESAIHCDNLARRGRPAGRVELLLRLDLHARAVAQGVRRHAHRGRPAVDRRACAEPRSLHGRRPVH